MSFRPLMLKVPFYKAFAGCVPAKSCQVPGCVPAKFSRALPQWSVLFWAWTECLSFMERFPFGHGTAVRSTASIWKCTASIRDPTASFFKLTAAFPCLSGPFGHSQYIGVDFALWAKKLCQEDKEVFNGLKRESAADALANTHPIDMRTSIRCKLPSQSD